MHLAEPVPYVAAKYPKDRWLGSRGKPLFLHDLPAVQNDRCPASGTCLTWASPRCARTILVYSACIGWGCRCTICYFFFFFYEGGGGEECLRQASSIPFQVLQLNRGLGKPVYFVVSCFLGYERGHTLSRVLARR